MTRRLAFLDRLVTLVVGLALVTGGLALIDWATGTVFSWPQSLSTGPAQDVVGTPWFPWALAAGTVVLGLLALWWLLAHVPRPERGQVRVEDGNATGSVSADLGSIADAAAERFGRLAPVLDTSGAASSIRGRDVVEIRARVDVRADAALVHEVAVQVAREVEQSAPATKPVTRVLLDTPRRLSLSRNDGPSRVH